MYGKLFEQMYNGTLGTKGPWQALVTFQQMIILADSDGVVDMTPEVISKRSTIPIEIIQEGLKCLSMPDPDSRTPTEEGRRIIPLDTERSWGWRIVNHAHYRKIRSEEERREYMKNYQRQRRAGKHVNQPLTPVNNVTHAVCSMQEAVKDKSIVGQTPPDALPSKHLNPQAREVLDFLNEKTGRAYKPVKANLSLIAARLKEGATVMECRQVIAKKSREWAGDEKMAEYLRPKTLFSAVNFGQYSGELVVHD